MSKYNKGNYGNSRATTASSAASSASVDSDEASSWLLSSATNLVDVLDSYGIDLTAMLLLFWCIVAFLVVFGVNLYLTLTKRNQRLQAGEDTRPKGRERADEVRETITASTGRQNFSSAPLPHGTTRKFSVDQVSGRDEDSVKWIQKVIDWLYQSAVVSPGVINESIDAWLASLNSKGRKLIVENGIYVEFVRLYRDQSTAIRFVDVKVENELNDNILATLRALCDRLVIQVRVAANSRDLSNGQSSLYEIVLDKFSALLKVVCKPEDSLFVARFLERPETKVHINGPLTPSDKSYSPDLIINGILNILTSTLVDINFCLATNFPKYPNHRFSSFDSTLEIPNGSQSRRPIERKLFVTVVKANHLALNQSKESHEVYCSIEINEPKEKRRTASVRKDASSPVWQDHFLFGLTEQSKEILFEVFDGYQKKQIAARQDLTNGHQDECLGYGIANILELRLSPSEKLVIPLHTRTSEKDGTIGSLEVELLLMEHKLPSPSVSSTEEAGGQISEKIASPKYMPEYETFSFRDPSSNIDHSYHHRLSIESCSCSSSSFTDHSSLRFEGEEELLEQDIAWNPIPNYEGNESEDDLFPENPSSHASSFLASVENESVPDIFACSQPTKPNATGVLPCADSELVCESGLMSGKGTYHDSLSTSNSSLTSSSTSPREVSKPKRFARLAKIVSLVSLASSGNSGGLGKSASNSSLSVSNGTLTSTTGHTRHRHPNSLYSTRHARFSQPIPSLAMSLPVISPLIDCNRPECCPTNGNVIHQVFLDDDDEADVDSNVPGIFVTQPSIRTERSKSRSLRWLKSAGFRRNSAKTIELPPTVLYPHDSDFPDDIDLNHNGHSDTISTLLRPGQSTLEIVNKRSSLYSQLSLTSIDSMLSLVDESTLDEDYLSSNRLVESVIQHRPPPVPSQIHLPNDSLGPPMYGKHSEKAKSDTHLFFCVDETTHEDAMREHARRTSKDHQFFFGNGDPMQIELESNSTNTTTPPGTPLKRNSNRRTSLYARFISGKRHTTKQNSPNNGTNSVKQRFKFRASSKVPKLAHAFMAANDAAMLNGTQTSPSAVSLSQSGHRASEPAINLSLNQGANQAPTPIKQAKMSLTSGSSVNLAFMSRDRESQAAQPFPLQAPPLRIPRRRSYKSADMSLMMHDTQTSSPLAPLTSTRTANSTVSHLDHYARSSLNTIKSDDNALSSEGYGTDRGATPDVSSEMPLPPIRPESRASQPNKEPRSLIRTIRKRLSFSKRSKSVERQPSNSFRERSVASNDDRDERARSVPGSREPSAPRDIANGKKQESFLSLASNTSFFAENSTLVLECNVNGEKKHYIVPFSKANKRKYRRRKGTKLHVFNDHLFVAQHVPSSMECQVCAKSFPLRIGKQGYQCRECGFLTHKQCHVNVDSFCPANGAARLNLEMDSSDTPKQIPSPVPEVRVIAPSSDNGDVNQDREIT